MKRLGTIGVFLSLLVLVALGGVVALFLLQNSHWVLVRFPSLAADWAHPFELNDWESPLSVVVVIAFLAGIVLALLGSVPIWIRRAVQRSRDRRFIRDLEGELSDLRNMPLNSPAPLEDIADEPESEGQSGDDEEEAALLLAALNEPKRDGGR